MNDTPPNTAGQLEEQFLAWELWKARTVYAQQRERMLRESIIKTLFPDPKEGANKAKFELHLAPGLVDPLIHTITPDCELTITLDHKIERKIDEAVLDHVRKLPELSDLNFDELIRRKPELSVRVYRGLTTEQARLFDQCLTVKPGSPQLSFKVKPSKS